MLEKELHFLLLRAFHHCNRQIVQQVSGLSLLPGQPKILEYLLTHEGCMAREIRDACVLDKSTVTSLLARMEKQGLICRRPSLQDRRASHIWLTDTGRQTARKVSSVCRRVDETALGEISREDQEHLTELLQQIIKNLEEEFH